MPGGPTRRPCRPSVDLGSCRRVLGGRPDGLDGGCVDRFLGGGPYLTPPLPPRRKRGKTRADIRHLPPSQTVLCQGHPSAPAALYGQIVRRWTSSSSTPVGPPPGDSQWTRPAPTNYLPSTRKWGRSMSVIYFGLSVFFLSWRLCAGLCRGGTGAAAAAAAAGLSRGPLRQVTDGSMKERCAGVRSQSGRSRLRTSLSPTGRTQAVRWLGLARTMWYGNRTTLRLVKSHS